VKHEIEFASHPANLALVRNVVRDFVRESGLSEKQAELVVLGVDEACTNIIRHVYKHEVTHLMSLNCERFDGGVRFRVRDFGPQSEQEMTGRPLDVVRPGGLGLHLIRNAFDHVDYVPQATGTEVVLTKNFPAEFNAPARS
jgi:anti-sigma regulatory factor (Ser/Thr protein kinase)